MTVEAGSGAKPKATDEMRAVSEREWQLKVRTQLEMTPD